MSAPVRLALVGCGRISQTHFQALSEIDDIELVGVCDIGFWHTSYRYSVWVPRDDAAEVQFAPPDGTACVAAPKREAPKN